jgi:hypothetical protein
MAPLIGNIATIFIRRIFNGNNDVAERIVSETEGKTAAGI